ncbi:MAG: cyclic nucleotide-binding domain-containing protein [Candidatus Puniceispirillaceae bacterium]
MSTNDTLHLLPGDYVFREGEYGQTAYQIETGTIELVKNTGDKHTVLAELEEGALFGEMAIIENSPRSASARAKTDCTLKIITEERLKKHLSSSPTIALDMMRRLASYARSANERLTRDAFDEQSMSGQNQQGDAGGGPTAKVDFSTNKTLREFNDDIDEFSNISPSRPLSISGIVIILMVVAFGVWASIAEIDVTVSARGKIMTSIPNVLVQSNYSSVIKTILVEEGEDVEKGQPIALFDETLIAADYRDTKKQLSGVDTDIERTQAEISFMLSNQFKPPADALQKAIFDDQVLELSMQKRDFNNKIVTLEVQLKNIDFQLETSMRQLNVKRSLLAFLQGRAVKKMSDSYEQALFDSKVGQLSVSLDDLISQVAFLETEVMRTRKLAKVRLIPETEYDKKLHELAQAQLQHKKFLNSNIATLFDEISALEQTIHSAEIDRRKNAIQLEKEELENEKFISGILRQKNALLQELQRKRQGLAERFVKLNRQIQDVEVVSPISGTILKLEDRFEGSVIGTGDVIATIVPEDVNYHVEVDIDPSDITHVYQDAEVKILLDALPSQKHGELKGEVSLLSRDTVNEDVFGEKRDVYRADVTILENNLVKLPDGFKLLPSMSVTGNIKSGKRTIMTYLLFPVIKTLNTSFREP